MCEINPKHSAFFDLEVFTSDPRMTAAEFTAQVLPRLLEAEMNLNVDGKFRFHIHSKPENPSV